MIGIHPGDEITPELNFSNPRIEKLPPMRTYKYLYYEGEKFGKPFTYELKSVPFEEVRDNYKNRYIDMPPVVGHWKLMNYWINSLWEALYNPITQLLFPPEEIEKRHRKWAVIAGQHRLRLLDAMEVDTLWFYEADYPGFGQFDWRITEKDLSGEIQEIYRYNHRPPERGTMSGTCRHCGKYTSWKKETYHKLWDVRMRCKKCGRYNPYPYPGRL